jgi:CheY-like chemotaxis protein
MRILVCEDAQYQSDIIKNNLTKKGHDVHQAFNRTESLDKLKEYFFGIAFIDLNLEGKFNPIWRESGGVKILKYIQEQNYGTFPIVMSGNPETRLAFELARDFAVKDYIAKGEENSASAALQMVSDYGNQVKIRYPENAPLFLSGIREANSREMWITNSIMALSLSGGADSFFEILNAIMKQAYPIVTNNVGSGLVYDFNNKSIKGEFWSLKYGSAIEINIIPKGSNKQSVNETIFEENIANATLSILKKDVSYVAYMS